jgi:hypothetical protein
VQHLFGVNSTADWRKAFNACLPKLTEYGLEMSLSEPLYRAYKALADSEAFKTFSAPRKKVVNDALRDFKLSGIALPEEQKEQFKKIALRLSELQSKFEENLMDSTQAWSKLVTDESQLAGMTDAAKEAARDKAKAKNQEGWLLTLDFPSYDAVITYSKNRELRRELYEAYATRASDQGPLAGQHDNTPLMSEILALRDEQAKLLGFNNFAELSLATKMAESPNEVEHFLLDLASRAKKGAQAELQQLRDYAKKLDGLTSLGIHPITPRSTNRKYSAYPKKKYVRTFLLRAPSKACSRWYSVSTASALSRRMMSRPGTRMSPLTRSKIKTARSLAVSILTLTHAPTSAVVRGWTNACHVAKRRKACSARSPIWSATLRRHWPASLHC